LAYGNTTIQPYRRNGLATFAGAKRPAGVAVRQAIDLARPLTIPELDDATLGERRADVPEWRMLIVVE